jgi:hypothetical protein
LCCRVNHALSCLVVIPAWHLVRNLVLFSTRKGATH